MFTLQEIQQRLAAHRLEVVAAETGLSFMTVGRYAAGRVRNPPVASVEKLSEWLRANEGRVTIEAGR